MAQIPAEMTVPHFAGQGKIGTAVKSVPQPGPEQLLLRVQANALCGSERPQFFHGSGVTPGHEAAGAVVAADTGTKTMVGTCGAVFLIKSSKETVCL
jgi:threonine 3-dehydrogenase